MAEEIAFRELQAVGEGVEAGDLGLGERGNAGGAVAVDPVHMVRLLAGEFHEVAEKELLFGG